MSARGSSTQTGEVVESDIAGRLDRLPWSRWHWFVVIALGVTWILDGLEVTLAGTISGVLQKPEALKLTDAEVGMSATFYLAGNVFGALLFGFLTDSLAENGYFRLPSSFILSARRYQPALGTLPVTRHFG